MMKRIALQIRIERTVAILLVGSALTSWSAPTRTVFGQHRQGIGVSMGFVSSGDKDKADKKADKATAAKVRDRATTTDVDKQQATSADSPVNQVAQAPGGTPNSVVKFDGSGNPTANSVMFDDGTNVGIGTTNPLATLEVHGIGGFEQSQQGRNNTPTVGVFSTNFLLPQGFGQLGLYTTDPQGPDIGGQLVLGGQDGVTGVRSFAAIAGRKENHISDNRDGYLQFSVRSNVGPPFRDLQERMRITSAGNVGIGTTNPFRKLEVVDNIDSFTSMGVRNLNTGSRATAILAVNSDGAQLSLFAHSSSYLRPHRADRVAVVAESNAAGVDMVTTQASGDIRMFTGGYSDFNERMRITNTGNVGIGMSSPASTLDVAGTVRATNFVLASDARLKNRIMPLVNAFEKLERIRGVVFEWNEMSAPLGHTPGQRDLGVIAQEVEAAFPELVATPSGGGYKGVDYSRLTAVLVEAVKELKAENKALQQRVEALEKARN